MTTATSSPPKSLLPRRRLSAAGTQVGVDIGSHSVKIVQLETGGGTARPRATRIAAHAHPLVPNDPQQCLAEIERTLQRAWSSRNRWWPLSAACTLSMSLMTFRSFDLPESETEPFSPEQLHKAFFDESEAAPAPWMIEGWPTQRDSSSRGYRSYAALGIQEDFATAIAAILWRCGLDCQILDGLPFAMARAAASLNLTEPTMVIDWGHSAMTLTVAIGGRPYFTRVLRDCELRSLTAVMMKPLELEAEQCWQLLEAYGFSRPERGADANNMAAVLAEISAPYLIRLNEELRRTWSFLQQLPGQMPKSIVLMGGGATLKMSAELVRAAMPAATEIWSIPGGVQHQAVPASFGPAMALASLLKSR